MTRLRASSALSKTVVNVDADARAADLLELIEERRATHAVVYDGDQYLGLVRLQDILLTSPDRIFADLVPDRPAAPLNVDASLDEVDLQLAAADVDALPLRGPGTRLAGIVTRSTVLEARAAASQSLLEDRQRLLAAAEESRADAEREASEHRELLAQVTTVNALGEMVSGIAHEIKQPLLALSLFAETCQAQLRSDQPDLTSIDNLLQKVAEQVTRSREIIDRLRDLVKRGAPRASSTDINEVVHNVVSLIAGELKHLDIALELDLAQDLPAATADPIQIEQVLVNLMQNAIEAMRSNTRRPPKLSVHTACLEPDMVSVTVSDSGPGLDDETLGRVFDPFFSTKPDGMGIGLAISQSIMKAHGGDISVERNMTDGLSFSCTLRQACCDSIG